MDKGLVLGFIADRVLPKSEYKRLASKFTKDHQNATTPALFDIRYKIGGV